MISHVKIITKYQKWHQQLAREDNRLVKRISPDNSMDLICSWMICNAVKNFWASVSLSSGFQPQILPNSFYTAVFAAVAVEKRDWRLQKTEYKISYLNLYGTEIRYYIRYLKKYS